VELAPSLEAVGDAETAETIYRVLVEWSGAPRPHQSRELFFVRLAGRPVTASLRRLAELTAARGDAAAEDFRARAELEAKRARRSSACPRGQRRRRSVGSRQRRSFVSHVVRIASDDPIGVPTTSRV
jgi:hypothetical protein